MVVRNNIHRVASNVPITVISRDFGSAMRAHQPKLYRTACFLTGNNHEGEDLLQETLLEAWKGWNSFEGRSSVYTWLYRILINRYHRWQRRQIVRRMLFVGAAEQDWKDPRSFIDPSDSPRSLIEHDEQNAELWEFLDHLRPKHREVLVLRYVENMRLEQICETLRVPLGTVKSRLNHAHLRLGQRLEKAGITRPKL